MEHNESSAHNGPSPPADGPAAAIAACVAGPPPGAEADGAAKPVVEVKVGPAPAAPAAAAASVAKGYIDLLIDRLTDRANWLGRRNAWILWLTAAIITACFYIFWRSDSIVEHLGQLDAIRNANAAEREKLVKKRDELTAKFGDADYKLTAIETKEKAANLVLNYLGMVQEFSKSYSASSSYNSTDKVDKCRARIASLLNNPQPFQQALAVVEAVNAPPPDGINIDYGNQKITVPAELLKAMAGELAANGGVRADAVAAGLKGVDERLRKVNADLGRADERAAQEDLAALETLLAANYGGVKKAYDAYAVELKNQGNQSQAIRLTNIRQELGRVDTQLAELDKQTAELQRKAYESVNSYGAWVPSLAVRVCCVILALFLTQFFMSIYRYNTMISTHYHSRADVLRMTCAQGQADSVNADTFVKLMGSMTIEKVDFILPENVIPKILEAAKIR
jgi:hypothetical protein